MYSTNFPPLPSQQTSTPTSTSSSPTIAATPAPDLRDPRIIALEKRFNEVSDLEVLQHCLGAQRVPNIPAIADDFSNHIIVVCLDCEHWSNNTEETTEVGIATFKRTDTLSVVASGNLGDHGENLLKKVKFYLLRISETSHLPNGNPDSRGVLGNRFGQGRFVTFKEAREVMYKVFVQPLDGIDDLEGNHPIVVLGQDIGHDKNNLAKKSVAFDIESTGTVVRWIDTQVLVRDVGYWSMPKNEQIGLRRLVEELWFEHSDPHTAANDAARTLISAFQIALDGHPCKDGCVKSMLQVATGIEVFSVRNFKPIGGVKEYCWRCGEKGHMKEECEATGLICDECVANQCVIAPGDEHITMHCMCIANTKALERREKDKANRLLKKAKPYFPGGASGFGTGPMGAPRGPSRANRSRPNDYYNNGGYAYGNLTLGPMQPNYGGRGGVPRGRGGYGSYGFGRGSFPPGGGYY
jgi:hypothetical protein